MNNYNLFPGSSSSPFLIAITAIAAGLGIYGFWVVTNLSRSSGSEPHGQQVDKFMIGVFNIVLSLVAIYIVTVSTQFDTYQLLTQTNRLLGQIK